MAYYVFDENNNKIEVTDKVLTALVEQIRCCVSGTYFKEAFVTQAKYNELVANGLLVENCIYNISDDTTCEDIDASLKEIKDDLNKTNNIIDYNDEAANKRLIALENKKLYRHNVKLYSTQDDRYYELYITIYNFSETELTRDNVFNYTGGTFSASGFAKASSSTIPIFSVTRGGSNDILYLWHGQDLCYMPKESGFIVSDDVQEIQ